MNDELRIMNEDWVECTLGEVCNIQTGKYDANHSKSNGKYRFYTCAYEYLWCNTNRFNGESIILPGNGANVGEVFYYNGEFDAYQRTYVLNNISIDEKYLYYHLKGFWKSKNIDKQFGSATNYVRLENFTNYNFPLAPLPIQRAIVAKIEALFSDLDNGIANLKKAQEQLKIYRQAVLKKAFEGELTKDWREEIVKTDVVETHGRASQRASQLTSQQADLLPTAEELLEQIKEERQNHYEKQIEDWKKAVKEWELAVKTHGGASQPKKPTKPKKLKELPPLTDDELKELPKLPDNWDYNYLAYAGELARGKSKHRPRNDKKLFGGNYPFFQTGDVKAQKILKKYSQTYNETGLAQSKLWKSGTLCITIAANIAETGFLGIDACFPDSIVGYSSFDKIVNNKYIDYFFQSAKHKISAWAPATAQKNINLTILENLLIPFCSLPEQTQIVQEIETRLSVTDNLEFVIRNSLLKAESLRQSILKKAFEGRLLSEAEVKACKQEPDYEPASVLLARIERSRNEKIKAEKVKTHGRASQRASQRTSKKSRKNGKLKKRTKK